MNRGAIITAIIAIVLMQIIILGIKLQWINVVDWSWVWVMAFIWVPVCIALALIVFAIALMLAMLDEMTDPF